MKRYLYNLNSAVEAVFNNKFRSVLTALGIIFGVAAVIAMMAIGNGARQEILEQIKMVGVNNIVITPKIEDKEKQQQSDDTEVASQIHKKSSPGLTLADATSIREIVPGVQKVSPEVVYNTFVVKSGVRGNARFSGIEPDFFEVYNLELFEGKMFSNWQLENAAPVCIIGPDIRARYFKQENPIGKKIKCGGIWLEVIGITKSRTVSETATKSMGISEFNNSIFSPIKTVLLRYRDRSLITRATMMSRNNDEQTSDNPNQLDKLIVQIHDSEEMTTTAKVIQRMLQRRHNGEEDFEIIIPELLLRQQQRTKDIFNIVLGAIASISLIVGGIGIMNIMLASVMERISEIGLRKAIGARKNDIIFQFVAEATIISITGGFIGILLGVILAAIITSTTGILTIVSMLSIIISFGVAATVGIIFGLMPARKAASQDPVTSLRHE